jgi:CRP-like cAMP-binding protein
MLRRQPLLKDLDAEALAAFMEAATASLVREHTQIVFAGSEATDLYMIVSGVARAEEGAAAYSALTQGDVIGEEALNRGEPYRRTITAQTDMRVIALSGTELRRLARKYPVVAERLKRLLGASDTAPSLDAQLKALEKENQMLRHALSELALKQLVTG